MNDTVIPIKGNTTKSPSEPPPGHTVPLQNVTLAMHAIKRAMDRPTHLDGIAVFYGPAGWGKSYGAAYAANRYNAVYVEMRESWTGSALYHAILRDLGIHPKKTRWQMAEQIGEQLALSQRPLIIDEADYAVRRNLIGAIRDIYELSRSAILLIGEELLPTKLREFERFHSRVIEWAPAQPADLSDARKLRDFYAKTPRIDEDLLTVICEVSAGSARRICVNLELAKEYAREQGVHTLTLAHWGDRPFYSGDAPRRKV
jgi:DNA transposition AAA+ family ATPase